jgi:hypothetical protein
MEVRRVYRELTPNVTYDDVHDGMVVHSGPPVVEKWFGQVRSRVISLIFPTFLQNCVCDSYVIVRKKRKERFSSRFYRYVFCYFPFKRILNTRLVCLRVNPTCKCSIVHPDSSFEELCAVYLLC